ncbi:hypothetical protein CEXT_560301 [Caerostris extrusa]|uniref:Uncharacterized protein n=1 Tax=Caerostris extrusa TaxID=172846 RepID=A0AAV4ML95_CAEEX|nr:hypothetical protein CEXT_560301 [Caerostris extrusa]
MLARVDTSDTGSGSEHTGGFCIDLLLQIYYDRTWTKTYTTLPPALGEEECNTRWLRVVGLGNLSSSSFESISPSRPVC